MNAPWPKRPDGSNKTMGEMTPAERRAQFTAACQRLKAEFERPEVQAALQAALDVADSEVKK
jgi:hypothetical protein